MKTVFAWLLVILVGYLTLPQGAFSLSGGRLPLRLPRPDTPPAPVVPGGEAACQDAIRGAALDLASATHRSLGGCLLPGLACLDEAQRLDDCCAAVAPRCARHLESIESFGADFERRVTARVCSGVSFARILSPDGLGFAAAEDACRRLDPPVAVSDLDDLAECLRRLITEDVVHRATTVEHPRALEAVLCMGIENDLPGVLRDDPATCEGSGGPVEPPPSPTPGATPKPTPTAAPGGPTPTANPGGPTPTPATTPSGTPTAGATPTPGQSSCTKARVTVRVIFEQADFPDVSGVSVTLDYPEAKLDLPGFGAEPTVLARVSNLTGVSGGLFSVGDQDDEINVGLVSISSPIPSGDFARVEFDCRQGAGAPGSSEVSCTVDGSTLLGNPVDASCTLQLSVN